jgi:hypothetical protein
LAARWPDAGADVLENRRRFVENSPVTAPQWRHSYKQLINMLLSHIPAFPLSADPTRAPTFWRIGADLWRIHR